MCKLTWSTVSWPISQLKDHPKNPRQITTDQMDQLKKSIQTFDYVEIIAVNRDGTILAGHMRIKAMIALGRGHEVIDVRAPSRMLTEKEEEEYLIRSNANTGNFDYDLLLTEFPETELIEWGFTEDQLSGFILDPDSKETEKIKKKEKKKCPSCGAEL